MMMGSWQQLHGAGEKVEFVKAISEGHLYAAIAPEMVVLEYATNHRQETIEYFPATRDLNEDIQLEGRVEYDDRARNLEQHAPAFTDPVLPTKLRETARSAFDEYRTAFQGKVAKIGYEANGFGD